MRPVPPITTIFMSNLRVSRLFRAWSTALFFLLLRDGDLLRVARVEDHRDEARLTLRGRVLRHPVEAPGRLVERLARLEHLGRLVVDPEFVFPFQYVNEPRP